VTPEGSTITTLALGIGVRILPRVYILHGKHRPSKIITCHYLRRLIPARLDGSLVKYSWCWVITPLTCLSLWWDRTYCRAPTRWRQHNHRSSRWRSAYTWLDTDEAKVILFINTSCLYPTWWWCCHDWVLAIQRSPHAFHSHTHMSLHEDTTMITRILIGGFLQTCSVGVINRAIFSHKVPGIGELCNL
jgi:hypothetical protein